MHVIQSFSRRIFLWTFFIMAVLCILLNTVFYLGTGFLFNILPIQILKDAAVHSDELDVALTNLLPVLNLVQSFFIPLLSCVFFLFALMLWLILRGSIAGCMRKQSFTDQTTFPETVKEKKKNAPVDTLAEPAITKKEMAETNKRYYLHLLSVLQREGRLIDFFSEDLNHYEDAQIGAAVRSIQDNCKNSLKKHLNPKALIDQNEGESIVIPAGFDPGTIKLTGNVTGEPPFQGIVRHKGWRASRLELPTLTMVKDPGILAPAEVEVL